MRIRRSLVALLFMLLSCLCLLAQTNTRVVRGLVQDEKGRALPNAVITTEQGEKFSPNTDGSFEIRVPFQCRSLTFSAQFYDEESMEVDGSFMYVRLEFDKGAAEKARKEAAATAKAEQKQKDKEEKERLAAEKKERLDAEKEAKKKAEAKTWDNVEAWFEGQQDRQDSIEAAKEAKKKEDAEKRALRKAERAAEKKTLAKAWEEEEARLAAEQERLDSAKEARRKEAAEKKALKKAEKKTK